jgi:hypothetical protein
MNKHELCTARGTLECLEGNCPEVPTGYNRVAMDEHGQCWFVFDGIDYEEEVELCELPNTFVSGSKVA